jgi:hypothetical protein
MLSQDLVIGNEENMKAPRMVNVPFKTWIEARINLVYTSVIFLIKQSVKMCIFKAYCAEMFPLTTTELTMASLLPFSLLNKKFCYPNKSGSWRWGQMHSPVTCRLAIRDRKREELEGRNQRRMRQASHVAYTA